MPPRGMNRKERMQSPKEANLPGKAKVWVVPASWLLDQASKQLAAGNHNMYVGSDGKALYIRGFKPPKPPKGKKPGAEMVQFQLPDPSRLPSGSPPMTWGPLYSPFVLEPEDGGEVWFEDWPEPKTGGG